MKFLKIVEAFDASKVPALNAKLSQGRPLRVKYGIDPTTAHVHLGHTVPLRLLKAFQDEGHIAVIVMGDFTASIGDPTGRNELRSTTVTIEEARKNAASYLKQIEKVVDVSKAEINLNGNWFNNCDLRWVLAQLQKFTVSQILDREDFTNRVKSGTPIQMSELLYPLLQGYDSVELHADVELGGTEQMFNLNIGRDMQKMAGQDPQVCITLPILKGLDGEKKMGKSLGNYIAVTEEPFEMFSKVMSIPDSLMVEWYELLVDGGWNGNLIETSPPFTMKKQLGFKIVEQFHNKTLAEDARDEWVRQFSQRKEPTEIPVMKISDEIKTLAQLIVVVGFATSNNNARRLIVQNAVEFNSVKIIDPHLTINIKTGDRLKVSRKYVDIERS